MFSFKLLFVFGVLAVSLRNVRAVSPEDKQKIQLAMLPHITACSSEYGVTEEEIKKAKEDGTLSKVDNCLMGCIFKKINVINDQGLFDIDKAEELSKTYLSDDAAQEKALEVITTCKAVNDRDVTDGEKGCERAGLLLECFIPFKDYVKNNKLNYEASIKQVDMMLPADMKDAMKASIEKCKDVSKKYKDICEASYWSAKCIYEDNPKNFIFV